MGAGGVAAPYALSHGGRGARIAFHTELLPSLLSHAWDFLRVLESFVQDTFSGGKPPDPKRNMHLLLDQCIKYCPT